MTISIAVPRRSASVVRVCLTTAHQPRRSAAPHDATTPGRRRLHALVRPPVHTRQSHRLLRSHAHIGETVAHQAVDSTNANVATQYDSLIVGPVCQYRYGTTHPSTKSIAGPARRASGFSGNHAHDEGRPASREGGWLTKLRPLGQPAAASASWATRWSTTGSPPTASTRGVAATKSSHAAAFPATNIRPMRSTPSRAALHGAFPKSAPATTPPIMSDVGANQTASRSGRSETCAIDSAVAMEPPTIPHAIEIALVICCRFAVGLTTPNQPRADTRQTARRLHLEVRHRA